MVERLSKERLRKMADVLRMGIEPSAEGMIEIAGAIDELIDLRAEYKAAASYIRELLADQDEWRQEVIRVRAERDAYVKDVNTLDRIMDYLGIADSDLDPIEIMRENAVALATAVRNDALEAGPAMPWTPGDAGRDVLAERRRQLQVEGWSAEHDDAYKAGEMACAAACYAVASISDAIGYNFVPTMWPWAASWWKPTTTRRNLVKAGALIIAEIERLDRATMAETIRQAENEAEMDIKEN